jgi:hypothetical protein
MRALALIALSLAGCCGSPHAGSWGSPADVPTLNPHEEQQDAYVRAQLWQVRVALHRAMHPYREGQREWELNRALMLLGELDFVESPDWVGPRAGMPNPPAFGRDRGLLRVEVLVRLGRIAEARALLTRLRATLGSDPALPRLSRLVEEWAP